MIFKKKPASADPKNSMPPLEPEEDDLPDRGGSGAKWITLLCVILAIALVVSSLPSGISAVTKVNDKVFSATAQENTISTVLSGGGTLTAQEGEALSIPQALELKTYYVKNGDSVRSGDPIAAVDPVAVTSAISELQTVLEKLDSAIASASEKRNDTTIQAGSAGRVKKIYAQEGTPAADTVYEDGALMLLSLDGLMALDLDGDFQVGQSVTVTLPDGTTADGTVAAIAAGSATVTLPDDKAQLDDTVTVTNENGAELGTGSLYIHSMLRVTGAYGTVSRIHVQENQKVSASTTLLTMEDTGHTAEYARLLNRRTELEEQMESLVKLSRDGILYADTDGIVSGVDTGIAYTTPETAQRSHASPGYHTLPGNRMEEPSAPAEGEGTGGASGGESGGSTGGDPGTTPGGEETPDTPETPETPEQQDYTLGYVLAVQDGMILYLPQGTLKTAEGSPLPALSAAADPSSGTPLDATGLAVKCSTGAGWEDADLSQIAAGDTILIGNGLLVFQHNAAQMPSLDISSMLGGISGMTGMSGLTGGYSSAQATPVYDSYDITKKDVASITPTQEMTVDIPVDELDILTLQVGMEAQVTLDALPGQSFTGTITKINTYGSNSGGNTKYTVTVTLPRAEKMLPGMNASVKITTAISQPVQTVPAEAIRFDSGKSWLYTGYDEKKDTLLNPVEIQTGISDGALVELVSGLEPGTTFYYRYADTIEYSFVK